jgi:RNA polymerase sigma-70 factor (ECF subfamily)
MSDAPSVLELHIRKAWDARDLSGCATRALEAYGEEILVFLCARLRSQCDGREAFSMFAEDLWNGLPRFEWRCEMRTWLYTLARNAGSRCATSPQARADRNVALSGEISRLVEQARTRTKTHLRTDVKEQVRALRAQLDVEDQLLLILRVDRDMAWRDIAIAMSGNVDLDDEALLQESARLRKSFERAKAHLKRVAKEHGLIKPR